MVLKLKNDCHKMSDEELAKMGVHLLNCQSFVEGRQMYPCTDEMSIKDCTTSMDSDTWTSYHLMSNRARAVCYTIRQAQFRGLAEETVNKLMHSAQNQLAYLEKIEKGQQDVQRVAEDTFDAVSKGMRVLSNTVCNFVVFHVTILLINTFLLFKIHTTLFTSAFAFLFGNCGC